MRCLFAHPQRNRYLVLPNVTGACVGMLMVVLIQWLRSPRRREVRDALSGD